MRKRRKRHRERWTAGTVLWSVPIRFYDDPAPDPERCVVVNDDNQYDDEDEFSTLAFHDGYGHDVYLCPDDLYETRDACIAEVLRRRAAFAAEREADDAKLMAANRGWRPPGASDHGELGRVRQREHGRFKDAARFARKKRS